MHDSNADNQAAPVEWEGKFEDITTWDTVPLGVNYPSVQGRLKHNAEFWENELTASSFVRNIVAVGYRLPLFRKPPPAFFKNHASARQESQFVGSALHELTRAGCIVTAERQPVICSPLSVVESTSGKKRLVLDLRYVNKFLWKDKFKYEDIKTAIQMIEKGDYAIIFDLKPGYHHVDIHADYWDFRGKARMGLLYITCSESYHSD